MSAIAGIKIGREYDVKRARELGIMALADLVLETCETCKRYRSFITLPETDELVGVEEVRQPFPRPTILWVLAEHAAFLHGKLIRDKAKVMKKLSPHGRPLRPKKIATAWSTRPTNRHRAGDSARWYSELKKAAALAAEGKLNI